MFRPFWGRLIPRNVEDELLQIVHLASGGRPRAGSRAQTLCYILDNFPCYHYRNLEGDRRLGLIYRFDLEMQYLILFIMIKIDILR